jgi:hypothetical protein
MPTDQILALLIAERQKLDAAIEALGGTTTKRRGRPPGSKNALVNAPSWVTGTPEPPEKPARKKRKFSAKQRAEQAARMKAYWAKKKKAAKS